MRRASITLLLLSAIAAGPLRAQAFPSTAYLPLEHPAMPFLEHLVVRGVMQDPSPLERPWVVGEIVNALDHADTTRMTGAERRARTDLLQELRPRTGNAVFGFDLQGGPRARTHGRRDPVRPAGDGRVLPAFSGHGGLQVGGLLLMAQRTLDWHLRDDPDYPGDKEVPFQGRAEYAYLSYRSGPVAVAFGSVYRNWGPPSLDGLLVSPVPYSYDHLWARFGPRKLNLDVLVARLDDAVDANGVAVNRWWIAHRYNFHLIRSLDFSLFQSSMITGPGRGLDPMFVNPLRFALDTRTDTRERSNIQVGFDAQLALRSLPRFSLSILVDDQLNCFISAFCPRDLGDEPPSYGFSTSLDGSVLGAAWTAAYTQVSNLAYRTNDPNETMMIRNVGLARNFSDYDQTTLEGSWVIAPGVIAGPELTLVRQGEGDFRQPFPTRAEYDTTPTLFVGTVERTWRAAVHATVNLPMGFFARGNLGVHRVTNFGHVTGATDTEIVGQLDVRYRFSRTWLVP